MPMVWYASYMQSLLINMAPQCSRLTKSLIIGVTLIWTCPSIAHISYACPKHTDIQIIASKDKHGHLQCVYHAKLQNTSMTLKHIDRDIDKPTCPAIPGILSSVIFVRKGERQGIISCAYGPPNAEHSSWAMANTAKHDKKKLASCHLTDTNTSSTSHDTYTDCAHSPKKCLLICQKPVPSSTNHRPQHPKAA
jgi:hypothetical protein